MAQDVLDSKPNEGKSCAKVAQALCRFGTAKMFLPRLFAMWWAGNDAKLASTSVFAEKTQVISVITNVFVSIIFVSSSIIC